MLRPLAQLKRLNLEMNLLTLVALGGLNKLTKLSLSYNKLTTAPSGDFLAQLWDYDLSDNDIKMEGCAIGDIVEFLDLIGLGLVDLFSRSIDAAIDDIVGDIPAIVNDEVNPILAEFFELMDEDSLVARIQRQSWAPDSDRWERLYPVVEGFDYDPPPERSVKGFCEELGQPVMEFVYELPRE